jgi:hypothetical protein
MDIADIIDLNRYPLHRPGSPEWRIMVDQCRDALAKQGMFDLVGFMRPAARAQAIAELQPVIETAAFTHARRHNIYFRKEVEGLAPDHPALVTHETKSHTICGDQMAGSLVLDLYEWPEFAQFMAAVMDKPVLYTMADPLARVNTMGYYEGESLNWHFDRSEFTTTLLLQSPLAGGEFEFRRDLRSATDPNYDGVVKVLKGNDPEVRRIKLAAGALNVFRGKDTAHRVTPVQGAQMRIISVFSFFDRPGVNFTAEERQGFYGRAEPLVA